MIVPISSGGPSAFAPSGGMPSDTNLLMALAEMHKQGRFDQTDLHAPRSHHSPIEKEMKGG